MMPLIVAMIQDDSSFVDAVHESFSSTHNYYTMTSEHPIIGGLDMPIA